MSICSMQVIEKIIQKGLRKGILMHLRKVSTHVSLRSPQADMSRNFS